MHLVVDLKFFFIEFFEESAIIETQSVYHSQNTDLQTSVCYGAKIMKTDWIATAFIYIYNYTEHEDVFK